MRSLALKAALATVMLLGTSAPAFAYYPDDHVWDREYQSGVEWNYPVHRKAVPWISSVAWRDRYPTAPSWWSAYAGNGMAPANYTGWYDWRGTNAYNPTANYYNNNAAYAPNTGYNAASQAAAIAVANRATSYAGYAGYANDAASRAAAIAVANRATSYTSYAGYANDAASRAAAIANAERSTSTAGYTGFANPYATNTGYAAAPAYLPVANNWASYTQGGAVNPWDQMAWNVSWWDQSAKPMTNAGYYKAVFDSNTNPYSNTRLNQDLQVAAAYGDLGRVQQLVGAGADIHARDWEGYTPLTWAAQHGRRDVVNYLLTRFAQPNAVDRWGYTPLMWAVQQGHTDVAGMLIAKGANVRATTPYGVNSQVLATYAAGGAARGLIDSALAGRKPDYNAYYRSGGQAMANAAPTAYYQAPQQQMSQMGQPAMSSGMTNGQAMVNGAMAAQPMALAANPAMTAVNSLANTAPRAVINPAEGWAKLAALGANFGNDFKTFMSESTSGGIGLNTLGAFMGGDMETGKNLTVLFGKLAKDRDLKTARVDLDAAKPGVKNPSRFSKYVTDLDATLGAMGF